MIDYSAADLKGIAAIDESNHLGLLTNCGINLDDARRIVAATDEMLRKAIEMGEANIAKNPEAPIAKKLAARVAASRRELTIRAQ